MKRIAAIALMIIVFAGSAGADDYIRINIDSIPMGAAGVDFPFLITHECPDQLFSMSNGFEMTATGCTWTCNGLTPDAGSAWWMIGLGFGFTDGITGTTNSGWFGIGGAGTMPPQMYEVEFFSVNFDISNDEGEICIDSTSPWSWTGMTCGQGGAPDRPLFVDKYGSDDNHPICIVVYPCQSSPSQLLTSPFEDQLTGPTCAELSFDFDADCEDACSFSMLDGPGSIGQTDGIYTAPILSEGTYQITIQIVEPICQQATEYSFDLTYIAEVAGDMDCSGLTDIDDVVYTIEYIFSSGSAPHSDPDCSGGVDIDDVVYLINYIFGDGPPPCG
jgi:hypothetical protein